MSVCPTNLFFASLVVTAAAAHSAAQFTVTSDGPSLKKICGTDKVKLVFAAQNKLWFVDFSETLPQARSIDGVVKPQGPVISPDGSLACYASGPSDDPPTQVASSAWICDLAIAGNPRQIASNVFAPRFVQNGANASVVYSTCGYPAAGNYYCWNGCGKMMESDTSSKLSINLWNNGSWFGGLSFDGKWFCTAEHSLNAFMIDRSNMLGAICTLHTIHVLKNGTDADTSIRLQTCNPSISSSRIFPDAMMYLDFSSQSITNAKCRQPVLGEWGVHSRIFVSRASGSIVKYYDVPERPATVPSDSAKGVGEIVSKNWDNPEWSNHPYFAAASLTILREWYVGDNWNETERKEAVYLVGLHDSSFTRLLQINDTSYTGAESINWPWIWIETPADFAQTEDKEWLNHPIGLAIRSSAVREYPIKGRITVRNGNIRSSAPLASLEFYSLKGERIGKTTFPHCVSSYVPNPIAARGAYVIKCEFATGQRDVVRYVDTGSR